MASATAAAAGAAGSVERVRAALRAHGHPDTVTEVAATARTAEGAAAEIGCAVAQIVKSMVFRTVGEAAARPVLVLTSGANRVDPARVAAALGVRLERADAAWVRAATGFAIGGVAPVGHLTPPIVALDEELLRLDPIWAAAGSPSHVFRTTAADLLRMTTARPAPVRERGEGA